MTQTKPSVNRSQSEEPDEHTRDTEPPAEPETWADKVEKGFDELEKLGPAFQQAEQTVKRGASSVFSDLFAGGRMALGLLGEDEEEKARIRAAAEEKLSKLKRDYDGEPEPLTIDTEGTER